MKEIVTLPEITPTISIWVERLFVIAIKKIKWASKRPAILTMP
jgi:hypothetical protein